MKKNKINIKNSFTELEKILSKLESSNLEIDEMVKLYEKGMDLTRKCKDKIQEAEQKIQIINKSNDNSKEDLNIWL